MRHLKLLALSALLVILPASIAFPRTAKPESIEIQVGHLHAFEPHLTFSLLNRSPADEGIGDANVTIADNDTTGKFPCQDFSLDTIHDQPETKCVLK